MENIKTKWSIGNWVKPLHFCARTADKENGEIFVASVHEITTVTCTAGTQIFYKLRGYHVNKKTWMSEDIKGMTPNMKELMHLREEELDDLTESELLDLAHVISLARLVPQSPPPTEQPKTGTEV